MEQIELESIKGHAKLLAHAERAHEPLVASGGPQGTSEALESGRDVAKMPDLVRSSMRPNLVYLTFLRLRSCASCVRASRFLARLES